MSISAISDSSIYSLFQSSGLLGESSSTGQFSSALSDTGGSDASGTTTDLGALLQALSANSLLAQMFLGSTAGGSDGTGTSVSSISPTDSTSSTDTSTSSLEDDLASLIEALQSGDTESAQSIFAGILDKMQSVSGASSSDSSVSSVSSTSTMDLSSLLNNVGGSGGSSGGSDAASDSSSSTSSTASTDPADTNHDGTVDFNEYQAYYGKKDDMRADAGNARQAYQQGTDSRTASKAGGMAGSSLNAIG